MKSRSKIAQFNWQCIAPFRAQYEANVNSWSISVLHSAAQCPELGRIILNENKIEKWHNIWILDYQAFLFGRFTGNSKGRNTNYVNSVWNKICHTRRRNLLLYVLITKANEMHSFSDLFDKVLYMFLTGPLSIIRSISTLYTRSKFCHASSVGVC